MFENRSFHDIALDIAPTLNVPVLFLQNTDLTLKGPLFTETTKLPKLQDRPAEKHIS